MHYSTPTNPNDNRSPSSLKHVMLRAGDGIGRFFRQFDQFDPNPITLGFRYPWRQPASIANCP